MADNKSELFDLVKYTHDWDVDPVKFQIYLMGREEAEADMEFGEPGVEYMMANRFIKNLNLLSGINKTKPILIHMKTCGGHVYEGHAIYDAILACPNPVTIVNYTHARSMSSIILQAANKRIMMPSSYFMFHEGDVALSGTPKQVRSNVEFDKHHRDLMLTIYAERMKHTAGSKVRTWTTARIKDHLEQEMNQKEDVFLTPQETVAWGFADEIFTDWESAVTYSKQQKGIK